MKINQMIGKKVQLYPNDTYEKFGIIQDWNEQGFIIYITKAEERSGYEKCKHYYIGHSSKVALKIIS